MKKVNDDKIKVNQNKNNYNAVIEILTFKGFFGKSLGANKNSLLFDNDWILK